MTEFTVGDRVFGVYPFFDVREGTHAELMCDLLRQLLETGKYRPVIDRRYRLEEVVEATKYVETEKKTGNVVTVIPRA